VVASPASRKTTTCSAEALLDQVIRADPYRTRGHRGSHKGRFTTTAPTATRVEISLSRFLYSGVSFCGVDGTWKFCARCERRLSLEAFREVPYAGDGHDSYCRECRRGYMRDWRARRTAEAQARQASR
jgi:hypothetical protein